MSTTTTTTDSRLICQEEDQQGIHVVQKTMSTTDPVLFDELILEILTKIPAKSLAKQFRSVCQPWCDLMTDPSSNFIQTHLNRSIERDCPNLLSTIYNKRKTQFYSSSCFDDEEEEEADVDAEHILNPFKQINIETEVLASFNGLICLYTDMQSRLCLFNPCTRETKFLNVGKPLSVDIYSAYGLGYDSVVGEYILVSVLRSLSIRDDVQSRLEVYSLNHYRNAICLITSAVPYKILNGYNPGVNLNGCLHWVGVHEDRLEIETIVSFDIRERSFQELLPPNQFQEKTSITGVGILRGKLCMLCYFPTGDVEIWAMNEYDQMDSWTKQFAIEATVFPSVGLLRSWSIPDNNGNVHKDDDIIRRVTPLHFFKSDKILLRDGIHLVIYDPKQKNSRKLMIRGIKKAPLKVVTYFPSLVPVNTNMQW